MIWILLVRISPILPRRWLLLVTLGSIQLFFLHGHRILHVLYLLLSHSISIVIQRCHVLQSSCVRLILQCSGLLTLKLPQLTPLLPLLLILLVALISHDRSICLLLRSHLRIRHLHQHLNQDRLILATLDPQLVDHLAIQVGEHLCRLEHTTSEQTYSLSKQVMNNTYSG